MGIAISIVLMATGIFLRFGPEPTRSSLDFRVLGIESSIIGYWLIAIGLVILALSILFLVALSSFRGESKHSNR